MKDNSNFLVSIIIVTYNAEKYIGKCLQSVAENKSDNTEVVIIDGSSIDNTLAIVKEYAGLVNKVVSERDGGIYDAMNKGALLAKGKFLYFLGADDLLMISFDKLSELLLDTGKIYYGNVLLLPKKIKYGGVFTKAKLLNRNICHQSIFYPAAVFKDFKFNCKYRLVADYELNLRLWAGSNYDYKHIDAVIAGYSIEGASSTKKDIEFKKDAWSLVYSLFGFYGLLIKCFNPLRNFLIKRG